MIIEDYFQYLLNRDNEGLANCFHSDAKIYWPVTNEVFNVHEFVELNDRYPDKWIGKLQSVDKTLEGYVYAGSIENIEKSEKYFVTGFAVMGSGKIIRLTEYWAAGEEAPSWRKQMHIGKKIL